MPRPSIAATPGTRDWWWVFDPRQSLRARAALLVGAGTVAFTVALIWLTGTIYRRALEKAAGAWFETMAVQVSDKIDRALYERYRTLVLAATFAPVRDPAAAPVERRRALEALLDVSPEFAWLGIADPSGRIVAGTGGLFENTSAALRPWFRAGRENAYAGPVRENAELAQLTVAQRVEGAENPPRYLDLAVPIRDAQGELAGVLAAQVRWNWARDIQVSVVPENLGTEQIGVTVYAGNDVLLDSGASGWTHPPEPPQVADNRRGRGVMLENTSGGTTYVSAYARSRGHREYRGLGWLSIVRQPVARAFMPVATLRRTIGTWGFSLSAIAVVAAWILAGRHARRLRSVRAAAERIHEGDILAVLPRPRGDSELARMCGAVGDLVEDLRARQISPTNENAGPGSRPQPPE